MKPIYAIVWTRKDGSAEPFISSVVYDEKERAMTYCNNSNKQASDPHFGYVVELAIVE